MDWQLFILGFLAGGVIMGLAPLAWFVVMIVVEVLLSTPGNVPGHPEPDLEAENARLRRENERLRRELEATRARLREAEGKQDEELEGLVDEALQPGH